MRNFIIFSFLVLMTIRPSWAVDFVPGDNCTTLGVTHMAADNTGLVICGLVQHFNPQLVQIPTACGQAGSQTECKWKAMSGTADTLKICAGIVNSYYYNGQPHSVPVHVNFPATCSPCNNPRVFTETIVGSVYCGDGSGIIMCPNDPSSTSQDLTAYHYNLTTTGFDAIVSGMNGVWVGASSPPFPINWMVACDP